MHVSIVFSMVRSRVRLRIRLRWAGEAMTNAANSSIAHTHRRRKGNKSKRRREREREARENESEIKKNIAGAKNNSQASDHSNFVKLARLFNAVHFLVIEMLFPDFKMIQHINIVVSKFIQELGVSSLL